MSKNLNIIITTDISKFTVVVAFSNDDCNGKDIKNLSTNRLFSYSEKESQSNDILLHFVEFLNVHSGDRSSHAIWLNCAYKNV